MNFGTSISTVFSKYVVFSGRARRSEYWWYFLFLVILDVIASIIDAAAGTKIVALLLFIATFLPTLAVGIRRLHDTSRTGWWTLIALVPFVGVIVLIVFYCLDSTPGANQYGESPKGIGSGPGYGGYPAPGQYGPPPGQYGPPPGQYGPS